jgi:hypothetical protein
MKHIEYAPQDRLSSVEHLATRFQSLWLDQDRGASRAAPDEGPRLVPLV